MSITDALKAFGLEDTLEHRAAAAKLAREILEDAGCPPEKIVERDKPDSAEYFQQRGEG